MADVEWTRLQYDNTVKAIEVIRAVTSNPEPEWNRFDALRTVYGLADGDLSDAKFLDIGPHLVAGLINVAATLAEHYAQEAGKPVHQVMDSVTEAVNSVTIVD